MSALFQPFTLKDITLRNRIAVAPMCQYQATDGKVNDWHHIHYGSLAHGGAGLIVLEATAVAPEGRITPYCTGIWSDELAQEFAPIVSTIKQYGGVPGIQIAHAGRKASANRPWEGDDHIPKDQPLGWQTIAPSSIAFGQHLDKQPQEMTHADIARVRDDFVAAAKRALAVGFEWLELHFAHGYLAQSFFSEHSNQRTDQYGGNAENRGRFLRETFAAVREVWPEHLPLTIRFGVLEFDGNDEQTLKDSIELVRGMKQGGLDMISVSIGFNTPAANIPWAPAFMGPVAEQVRREVDIPVSSAWGFGEPQLAEAAIQNGQLDVVMVGKAHLANPHWSYHVARELKVEQAAGITLPAPYGHWLARY